MRAFIAIELSPDIKKSFSLLQDELKKSGADVKWVKPKDIHLTLKFLGEIDDKEKEEITDTIQRITANQGAFYLSLSSVGAFPKIEFPRIIWMGVDKGDAQTKQIAGVLEEETAKIGIPKEKRPFSSHITLGRVRSNLNRERLVKIIRDLIATPPKEHPQFLVSKITLYKSTLTPSGPIYEAIKEVPLQNPGL